MNVDAQAVDIAVLKEQMKDTREDVKTIMTNHLPHLAADVTSIKVRMAYYTGASAVLGMGLQLALHFFQ